MSGAPTADRRSDRPDRIAIALPKGRLFPPALALFSRLGIADVETLADSRRLTVDAAAHGLRFLALKPVDIPVYVEHGAADLGIVGKDLLLQQGRDVYEPLDLGIRVHDRKHNRQFNDRYNRHFTLAAGERRTLRIPLEDIRHGPRTRLMDMQQISDITLFRGKPAGSRRLEVYGMRLE